MVEWVFRLIDNNRFRRLLDVATAVAVGERFEIKLQKHYCLTWWGICDLLSWVPTLIMLLMFFTQKMQNSDTRCIPEDSSSSADGGSTTDQKGCVNFAANWIVYVFALGMAARCFKFERRLRAFEVVRHLVRGFMGMYEYFVIMALAFVVLIALAWFMVEVVNPDVGMRTWMGNYRDAVGGTQYGRWRLC